MGVQSPGIGSNQYTRVLHALADLRTQINSIGSGGDSIPLTGTNALSGNIIGNNDVYFGGKETGGTIRTLLGINSSNFAVFGNLGIPSAIQGTTLDISSNGGNGIRFYNSGVNYLRMFPATGNLVLQNGGTFVDNGNRLQVTGNVTANGLGLLGSITHTLTLGSTANGFSYYNTVDQTTNYERVRHYWNSGVYTIAMEHSGTGTAKNVVISTGGGSRTLAINQGPSNLGFFNFSSTTSGNGSVLGTTGIFTNASGISNGLSILDTYNQSGTAGYRGLWVSLYEQSVGSGSKLLIDLGTNSAANGGGTHTTRFSVDNNGQVITGNVIIPTGRQLYVESIFSLSSASNISLAANGGVTFGRIFGSTGNWFLGTLPTDSGYKLDVVGTTRLQGNVDVVGNLSPSNVTSGGTISGIKIATSSGNPGGVLGITGTNAGKFNIPSYTHVDASTAASGTVAHGSIGQISAATITASNTGVTYTNASSLYIGGPPVAGTNITITNPYALFVNSGNSYFGGNLFSAGNITSGSGAIIADVGGSFQSFNISGANYERVRQYWSSNTYTTAMEVSGTGVARNLAFSTNGSNRVFTINQAPGIGIFNFLSNTSSIQTIIGTTGTHSNSSGISGGIGVFDTYNQSGTAGYRGLWISPYEQATGSGTKLLIDAGTNSAANGGGTHTSLFNVDNVGNTTTGAGNGFQYYAIAGGTGLIQIGRNGNQDMYLYQKASYNDRLYGRMVFGVGNAAANAPAPRIPMIIYSNGDVKANGIDALYNGNTILGASGSPVDSGEKLQVNGTSKFTGNMGIGGASTNTRLLEITGTGNTALTRHIGGSVITEVGSLSTQSVGLLQTSSGHPLAFGVSGQFRAFVLNSGNFVVESTAGVVATDIPSSIFTATSTTKGALLPRMTTVNRTAITSPANGLLVWDTTSEKLSHYTNSTTGWINLKNDFTNQTASTGATLLARNTFVRYVDIGGVINLPAVATAANVHYMIFNIEDTAVTITASVGEGIYSGAAVANNTYSLPAYTGVELYCNGSHWYKF